MKNQITNAIHTAQDKLRRTSVRCCTVLQNAGNKLRENDGQFVMDHAVVFVIIIVLGGLSLLLLKTYIEDDLANTLKDKINEFFN